MIGQRRIVLAALLTTAAVIVPCAAWYVAGSRAAEREADTLRDRPVEVGRKLAASLSARLGGRLEAIREAEEQRPHYHYQASYHDPQSTCHCASQTPSPLSAGLRDPLIEAHFQIDPYRDITLPTLHGDDWPLQVTRQWFDQQTALVAHIQDAAPVCQAAVDAEGAATAPPVGLRPPESLGFQIDPGDPALEVGPLVWSTIPMGGSQRLAALRRVTTSRGDVVQGFLISDPEILAWLGPSDYPVSFRPSSGDETRLGQVEVPVDLPGPEWSIELDLGAASEDAEARAAAILGDFQRTFTLGSLAAGLAGMTVVLLLWQTERLARQRSRFAASAAHELRTPLASLRLYGEMIAEGLGDPNKNREYAQKIAEESERLGRVVSNVLGFTRLERNTLQLELESGDVGQAVREVVERLEPAIHAAGARLELETSSATGRFEREALFRILQNLIDNAEKYTRGAGDRTIEVAVRPDDEGVQVEVADRGQGIPEGLRDRLFQPFSRGSAPDAPAGLGLGLSLVRELAMAQGGTVAYREREGGGTIFQLHLRGA